MTAAIELTDAPEILPRHPVRRLHRARVRPAPVREPLFDDETTSANDTRYDARTAPGALRLVRPDDPVLPFDQSLPFEDAVRPDSTRLVADLDVFDMRPTSRRALPDPAPFGRTLVQAVLEVLDGRRNPAQIAALVSSSVHAGLTRNLMRRHSPAGGPAPHVRSVHVCEPADGVAELSAVVFDRGRARAVALRLEGLDRRWRCVRLQIG